MLLRPGEAEGDFRGEDSLFGEPMFELRTESDQRESVTQNAKVRAFLMVA